MPPSCQNIFKLDQAGACYFTTIPHISFLQRNTANCRVSLRQANVLTFFFFQNSYLSDPGINVFLKCQICFHGNMKCHSWRWCSIQMWRVEGYLTCFQLYLFSSGCYTLKLNKEIKIYLSKVDLWQNDFYTSHYCLQQHSLRRSLFKYLSAGGTWKHFLLCWQSLPSPVLWFPKEKKTFHLPSLPKSFPWTDFGRGEIKKKKEKLSGQLNGKISFYESIRRLLTRSATHSYILHIGGLECLHTCTLRHKPN